MRSNYHLLSLTLCFMTLQIQKTILIHPSQNPGGMNASKNAPNFPSIPQKLLHSKSSPNQLSPFRPLEIPVKKAALPEMGLNGEETAEKGKADTNKELTNIMENLFEHRLPIPSEEEYFPSINESSSQTNCSQSNFSSPCQEVILHAPTLDQTTTAKSVVLSIIAIFSYTGNIATLTSILKAGRQATSTVYMLLVQLTIADLLVTTFCILTDAVWMLTVQWYGGDFLCKFVKFMQMFSLYLSTFILVLIGFDRLCAVRFPMARARAKKGVRNGIVCIWTLSAFFSSPQAVIFSVMRGPFVEDFYQCVTYAFYTAAWQEQIYTMLSLVLMFLLPLLILIVTYISIFVTITSQVNMFSERAGRSPLEDARSKILHKAKIKSLMITVVIVLAFVFCWTPYYVTMIISVFFDASVGLTLQTVVFFFGSSTAAINPLIYGAFHLRRRRRRKPRSSKSTSLNNNSSSSRVESSMMLTLRKGKKSREESNGVQMEFSSPKQFICQKKQSSTDQTRSLLV